MQKVHAKKAKSLNIKHMKQVKPKKVSASYGFIAAQKKKRIKKRRHKRVEKASQALEELSPKLNKYHLKTKKEIRAAVDKRCKDVNDLIDVKIVTERKQIKVKVSPGRPSYKSVYKNKWQYKYSIQWQVSKQAIAEASKKDGIFPLITNAS